ncbi:MAG: GntR family transcriptional regulator [Actinomycetota bacterium]|nr:GntR family transcriptional regulator [Actinomycetota bacterium]
MPTHISLARSDHPTLADRAYIELRDRIVSLSLPPGTPLLEDALISDLAVGRTPIREAIKRLALEDLVTIYPRRGTFVSEIEITDLAQIGDVRLQLEGHAAYRAAQRATAADRLEADALIDELDALRPTEEELMRVDARIHRFVYRCARNPYLESTLDRLLNLSLRIWLRVIDRLPHLEASVLEHRELLAAVRDGDAERARDLASGHVETFEREIRTVL